MNIELEKLVPADRNAIEALARATGTPVDDVLVELVHEGLLRRKENGEADQGQPLDVPAANCYEVAARAGMIGMVDDLPADWRTNPETWKDFGGG
jgi:hypothetical protein